MKKAYLLVSCFLFLALGCAQRADEDDRDDDGDPPSNPSPNPNPNPTPTPDIPAGTISCTDSGSVTTVRIRGILSRLHDAGLSPTSQWVVRFGYGGTASSPWISDDATYSLTMPSGIAAFSLLLEEPSGGTDHWFDVGAFTVTGTCSRNGNEFRHTPTGGGGGGTGNGSIHCSESGGTTTVVVTGPLIANVFENSGLPGSSPRLHFGYGGSMSHDWIGDTAAYTMSMPGNVAGFNFYLRGANSTHWFDVNLFTVTGTCSRGTTEFRHTPTGGGGGGGGTGYGTLNCSTNGSNLTVTLTGPIIANAFGNPAPNSSWNIRFGYGITATSPWNGDSATYTFTIPSATAGFNLYLQYGGAEHWFNVNQFNVTGSCSKVSTEFRHTGGGGGGGGGNGTVWCGDNGSETTVTISGGILSNLFTSGLSPDSNWTVRFGYGGNGARSWNGDSATYTLTMPSSVTGFNFVLRNPNGSDYPFNVNRFDVTGSCSRGSGEFRHTPASVPNGSVSCSDSGSTVNVTVSGGILAHLYTTGLNPDSSWRVAFGSGGGSDNRTWNYDTTVYVLSMSGSVSDFSLVLRSPNGNEYPFDVSEFDVYGSCYRSSGQFRHTPSSGSNGLVSCSEAGTSTNVTVSNGILAHLFTSGLNPDSSWTIRFGYGGGTDARSWTSDSSSYTLTMPGSVTEFGLMLRSPGGNEYAFDVNEFDTAGSCSKVSNAFRHTAQGGGDGFGAINCSISGPDMTVTVNGVLNHTIGGTINPTTAWKLQYGSRYPTWDWQVPYAAGASKPQLSWVNNSTTYTFTLASSVNTFNVALTDGFSAYWLDLQEYNVTGACSVISDSTSPSGWALRHN